MLKITILVVGRVREEYIKRGIEKFKKWLQPYCRLDIVQVEEKGGGKKEQTEEIDKVREEEGEKLLKALDEKDYVIILDMQGKPISSEGLARSLANLQNRGLSSVTFIIGGPFGLSPAVIETGDYILSLSPMTFTHEMVQLILLEQLYRAFKIMRGEPYHY